MLIWLIQWLRHSFLKQPSILQTITIVSLAVAGGYASMLTAMYLAFITNLNIINLDWLQLTNIWPLMSSWCVAAIVTSAAVSAWRLYDRRLV